VRDERRPRSEASQAARAGGA